MSSPRDKFLLVIERIASKLSEDGFRRRGRSLILTKGRRKGILEFQKSTKSTSYQIVFTINILVMYKELSDHFQAQGGAHFSERIGAYLPGRPDKWWLIDDDVDVEVLCDELNGLIEAVVLPRVLSVMDNDGLIDLWESGQSPGLTAGQRDRYLEKWKVQKGKAT